MRRPFVVPQGDVVVHCAGDYRSTIAVSLLASAGRQRMRQLVGGMGAWERVSAKSGFQERKREMDILRPVELDRRRAAYRDAATLATSQTISRPRI